MFLVHIFRLGSEENDLFKHSQAAQNLEKNQKTSLCGVSIDNPPY